MEEKTGGEYRAEDVVCVSLESLRAMDIDGIEASLMAVENFNKVAVNAVDYCDLKVFSTALYRAMARGKKFMFRTAARPCKGYGRHHGYPAFDPKGIWWSGRRIWGGIVVVGSHTQKTTAQLEALLSLEGVESIPFHSDLVLSGDAAFEEEIARVVRKSEAVMRTGKTAVCYTDRKLLSVENDTREEALVAVRKNL